MGVGERGGERSWSGLATIHCRLDQPQVMSQQRLSSSTNAASPDAENNHANRSNVERTTLVAQALWSLLTLASPDGPTLASACVLGHRAMGLASTMTDCHECGLPDPPTCTPLALPSATRQSGNSPEKEHDGQRGKG